MTQRYYARPASDKTDNWPVWFVADRKRGGLNATGELCDLLGLPRRPGATLAPRHVAHAIAELANAAEPGGAA